MVTVLKIHNQVRRSCRMWMWYTETVLRATSVSSVQPLLLHNPTVATIIPDPITCKWEQDGQRHQYRYSPDICSVMSDLGGGKNGRSISWTNWTLKLNYIVLFNWRLSANLSAALSAGASKKNLIIAWINRKLFKFRPALKRQFMSFYWWCVFNKSVGFFFVWFPLRKNLLC